MSGLKDLVKPSKRIIHICLFCYIILFSKFLVSTSNDCQAPCSTSFYVTSTVDSPRAQIHFSATRFDSPCEKKIASAAAKLINSRSNENLELKSGCFIIICLVCFGLVLQLFVCSFLILCDEIMILSSAWNPKYLPEKYLPGIFVISYSHLWHPIFDISLVSLTSHPRFWHNTVSHLWHLTPIYDISLPSMTSHPHLWHLTPIFDILFLSMTSHPHLQHSTFHPFNYNYKQIVQFIILVIEFLVVYFSDWTRLYRINRHRREAILATQPSPKRDQQMNGASKNSSLHIRIKSRRYASLKYRLYHNMIISWFWRKITTIVGTVWSMVRWRSCVVLLGWNLDLIYITADILEYIIWCCFDLNHRWLWYLNVKWK